MRSTMGRVSGAALLMLSLALAGVTAVAQQNSIQQPSSKSGTKAETRSRQPGESPGDSSALHLVDARHIAADQLATLISNLYRPGSGKTEPQVRVTVDAPSNRLIIATSPAVWAELEPLIRKLDVNSPELENNSRKMATISFKGLENTNVLQSALDMLLQHNQNAKYTMVDNHSMLLYGDEKTIAAVRDLCELLKKTVASSKESDHAVLSTALPLQVRLLWLVNGAGKDAPGTPLAGDLEALVPVLARLGIQHPRLITNGLIKTTVGGVFKSTGKSSFDGGVKLDFDGHTRLVEKMPYVNLQLKLTRDAAPDGKPGVALANIETDFQAPFNHFVLLGMTPLDSATAVFVLQITQPE
jgi:type II secretory pathway component GspD/PulD (secretin)